jgi:DNA-binding HxlR family transcriptional regulator
MFATGTRRYLRNHERRSDPGDGFLADCPARLTVELLADKWSAVVLYGLILSTALASHRWSCPPARL